MLDAYPDLRYHLLNIRDNVVDFLDPFQAGYYYLPAMDGSFSIKKVLPALFPDDSQLNYANLTGSVHQQFRDKCTCLRSRKEDGSLKNYCRSREHRVHQAG